jgi:lipoprotein NlpD
MMSMQKGFRPVIRAGFWLLAVALLQGCGEVVRAPVYEEGKMVARPGPPLKYESYLVTPSETLYSIAWKTNLDYRTLAAWNGLSEPYRLRPGQRLRLTAPHDYVEVPSSDTAMASSSTRPYIAPGKENTKASLTQKMGQLQQQASTTSTGGTASRDGLRWRWPTTGQVVRQFSASNRTRKGIQIGGREGQPVLAASGGQVVYRGTGLIGYGNLVIVKHNNTYLSAYGNNRKILVKEGQRVSAGQPIAEMGRDGGGKAMLHFEIRRKGQPVNPSQYLPRRS